MRRILFAPPCRFCIPVSLFVLLAGMPFSETSAQRLPGRADQRFGERPETERANRFRSTEVSVELLIENNAVALQGQAWQQIFAQIDVPVRIRQPLLNDEPEIRERTFGTIRQVKAIGLLRRDGSIAFPGRAYTRKDAAKLKEWLDELKTYGAQGAPEGQPVWGLDQQQFEAIFEALSEPVGEELQEQTLEAALSRLELPSAYSVRFSMAARDRLRRRSLEGEQLRQSYRGLSKGAALAVLLNEFGLGFRPLRTPQGKIDLVVDPLASVEDVWPVGWDLNAPQQQVAPKLFELIPVELDDVPFLDLLDAITAKTEVPILIDFHRVREKNVDLDELRVSYPQRNTSWSLLLRGITVPHKMTRHLKIDERGQPLVWITVLEPGKPRR